MKKRSLVVAIAMLIVSALVLTTATYAWFATGSAAAMSPVAATVSASDGSLLISADNGTTWKTAVATGDDMTDASTAYGDFTSATLIYPNIGTSTAGELTPVSGTPDGTNGVNFVAGTLNGTTFAGSNATAGWVKAVVKVKSTADAYIKVTPTFASTFDYGFCYAIVNTTTALYGATTGSNYTAVLQSNGTIAGTDSNANSIMDTADSAYPTLGGTANTAVAQSPVEWQATAETVYTVTFYIWAEGQHTTCTGATGGTASLRLDFSKNATATISGS